MLLLNSLILLCEDLWQGGCESLFCIRFPINFSYHLIRKLATHSQHLLDSPALLYHCSCGNVLQVVDVQVSDFGFFAEVIPVPFRISHRTAISAREKQSAPFGSAVVEIVHQVLKNVPLFVIQRNVSFLLNPAADFLLQKPQNRSAIYLIKFSSVRRNKSETARIGRRSSKVTAQYKCDFNSAIVLNSLNRSSVEFQTPLPKLLLI